MNYEYDKYNPEKIHTFRGIPFIVNKANNRITQFNAERNFEKAINTMHTWASRAFKLSFANPNAELREYELTHLEWKLDNIETWLGAMRKALEETRGTQRKQDTIDKLLALAEDSAAYPGEAENARRMAERRQEKM